MFFFIQVNQSFVLCNVVRPISFFYCSCNFILFYACLLGEWFALF